LKQLIRQATRAKQRDRLRAVELAIAGQPTLAIMRMLGRSRGFVQRWCYVYRDRGLEAVVAKSPPGRDWCRRAFAVVPVLVLDSSGTCLKASCLCAVDFALRFLENVAKTLSCKRQRNRNGEAKGVARRT
jgi:Homeodomain-like domain